MNQPSRITFWRSVLLVTVVLPFIVIWSLLRLAFELDVSVLASKSWMGVLSVFGMLGFIALFVLILTYFRTRDRILSLLEIPRQIHWLGFILLPVSLIGYTFVFTFPFSRDLLGDLGWVRFLVFWTCSLIGMYSLKAIKKDISWLLSLLVIVLFQVLMHLLVTQILGVTSYPFAMGWSETSRYYYPSLFLSERIFGVHLPWPILHPSLHLLLVPPYLVDAPLWLHRFWQLAVRFFLLGLTAQMLIWRLSIQKRIIRWLLWVWMFLYLFQIPVYFHLTVPLILMLWGYSTHNDFRTWTFLIISSIWCGLSRINWYPMSGILAAMLFFLEVPYHGERYWLYIRKPVLWSLIGFLIAFCTQRFYISLSGISNPDFFYTSLASNLLWYRLFPNASYSVGVLPAVLIASLPLWIAAFLALRQYRKNIHPLRSGLIFAVLFILFLGGLVVSMKIGGGVDIHNMDAYFSLLLIVTTYIVFGHYFFQNVENPSPYTLHWTLVVLLVAVPAWFLLAANGNVKVYSAARTQAIIDQLQTQVDTINAQGGEILFVTQRHLVSMHILNNVSIVPEYEREELMEMAMGNNQEYLQLFREDMENQRFKAIVVDPLAYRLLGKKYAFGEENNAWVQRVMKPILCNYQEDVVYSEDQIAIYVPQKNTRQCP